MRRRLLLLLLSLCLACLPAVVTSAAPSFVWSTLSPSMGVELAAAPLGRAQVAGRSMATSARLCPNAEQEPCAPFAVQRACLDVDTMREAWSLTPGVLESLYARFDLQLRIETQLLEQSSLVLTEITRTLLTEVLGYSVQIIVNAAYHSQLPRCTHLFDFHPSIWGTDWSEEEIEVSQHAHELDRWGGGDWPRDAPPHDEVCGVHGSRFVTFFFVSLPSFSSLFSPSLTPQLYFSGRLVPASCEHGGSTGVNGRNVWFVDTKSVEQGALQTPQPLALGFWMAYATPQGVANLPRLNLAAALADTVNMWFIPPLCREAGAVCGVAYGFSPYWEPGVAAQQIVNLRWLVALMFPAVDHDWFGLMNARMNETMPIGTTAQVLGFYFQPDVRTT